MPKKLSEKPSRRNRIKKEPPPCNGRPFPVTRTKRVTKGMRSDRIVGSGRMDVQHGAIGALVAPYCCSGGTILGQKCLRQCQKACHQPLRDH